MADPTDPTIKRDDFINYYQTYTTSMLGVDSFQDKMLTRIGTIFDDANIGTEQKGIALTELAVQTAVQYNKDAIQAALDTIRLEPEFELKAAQRDLVVRQTQGYDDNLKVKIMETQGSLASFAVNANSDSAQDAINDLKAKMTDLDDRVTSVGAGNNCPVPTPITPVPANFTTTAITDTTIDLVFDAVVNATLYKIYKDGSLIATQSGVTYQDTGLTAETKYAYNVKASINGIESDLSLTLAVTTDATPVP